MSIQAVDWALRQWIESPGAKLVLVAVANYVDHRTGAGWPSLGSLIEETCMSRRTIQRHVECLVGLGLVRKTERFETSGRQTSNLYSLDLSVRLTRPDSDEPDAADEATTASDDRGGGCQIGTLGGVTADTGEGVTADTPYETRQKEPPEEPTPPCPPEGGERDARAKPRRTTAPAAEIDPADEAAFDAWFARWPSAAVMRRDLALREWLRLSDAERRHADTALARFLDEQKRGRRRDYSATTYLRDRMFARLPAATTADGSPRMVELVPWTRSWMWVLLTSGCAPPGTRARARAMRLVQEAAQRRSSWIPEPEAPGVAALDSMVAVQVGGPEHAAWREAVPLLPHPGRLEWIHVPTAFPVPAVRTA